MKIKDLDMEKCMNLLSDMHDFDPDAFEDNSASCSQSSDELFEDDLELITAAGYQELMDRLRDK